MLARAPTPCPHKFRGGNSMRSSNEGRLALAAILAFTTTAGIACNSANTGPTSPAANGDVPKQKDVLDKLVAAYPNDERAQFALGNHYFGQQEYGPAVEHYKKAKELAPNYSPAYNILGYAYRQQGDFAKAEQAFKKYV